MKSDSSRLDEIAPDQGAEFLKQLDVALQGGTPAGSRAEEKALAEFGARAARTMTQDLPEATPTELKARIEQQLKAPPRGVARIGRLMARWRVGVLDLAALVVIGVLSVSLYFALQRKTTAVPYPKQIRAAAGDGEEKDKPSPAPVVDTTAESADVAIAEAPEAYDVDPDEPWAKELRTKLQEKVTFDFVDIALEDAITALNTKLKMAIVLDPRLVADGAHKTPLTLNTTGMSAEETLTWICRLCDVSYGLKDQALFICKKYALQPSYDTELYDISKIGMSAKLITSLIHDRTFMAEFADPAASVGEFKGKLLVTQRKSVQRKISRFLAVLGAKSSASEIAPEPKPPTPAWVSEVETALAKPLTFDLVDTPLSETLAYIHKTTGVNIILSPKIVASGPLNINLAVSKMSAKLALNWIMRLEGLSYEYRDHALFVRDAYQASDATLKIYNVQDLTGDANAELGSLSDLIRTRIMPDSWDAALGTSVEEAEGRLVVIQTPEVHVKIHELLAKLRGTGIKPEVPEQKVPTEPASRY